MVARPQSPRHQHVVPAYGLILIAAPATATAAVGRVLHGLPSWFHVPVVVALCGQGPERFLSELHPHVREAQAGQLLEPGGAVIAHPETPLAVTGPGPVKGLAEVPRSLHGSGVSTLMHSAASTFGSRVVALVLTGAAPEARDGVAEIRRAGGLVIAEDPGDQIIPSRSSLAHQPDAADYVLPLDEIPPFVAHLLIA